MLVGQVLAHAADPAERGVHARAGDHLHEVHDHLALAHGVEQRGHRAEVHRQRAGDQQVAGEPRQLGHQHADVLRPLRRLDVEELLDRQREGEVVGGRAEIVEPVGQREDLGVGEALGQLLGAAVEIADVGIDAGDVLGLHLEHEPQDAVGAGVLRAEVEQHLLGVRRRAGAARSVR